MSTTRQWTGLQCLVLGGGGFIGTNLCRYLARRGAMVRGFGRTRRFGPQLDGVDWFSGDISDQAALAQAARGAAVVFHLAGESLPDSSNQDPAADLTSNALLTLGILEICRKAAVGRIVFASSGGTVYGIPAAVPIPETAPTDPITAYGISKLAIEKYLALYHRLHGLDYAILRIANPFGPFQSSQRQQGVIDALLRRALAGQPFEIWGDGQVVRDFIYIDDVVEALAAAALSDSPYRLFNVGQGIGRSLNQVVLDLEHILGCGEWPRRYKPGRPADVPVNVLDIGLIQRELGWRPRTEWRQALQATRDWIEKDMRGILSVEGDMAACPRLDKPRNSD